MVNGQWEVVNGQRSSVTGSQRRCKRRSLNAQCSFSSPMLNPPLPPPPQSSSSSILLLLNPPPPQSSSSASILLIILFPHAQRECRRAEADTETQARNPKRKSARARGLHTLQGLRRCFSPFPTSTNARRGPRFLGPAKSVVTPRVLSRRCFGVRWGRRRQRAVDRQHRCGSSTGKKSWRKTNAMITPTP
eukprot:3481886-Rhodomonas_salina.2